MTQRFLLTQIAERESGSAVQVGARYAKRNAIVYQVRRNRIIFNGSLDGRDPRQTTPNTVLTAMFCKDAIFDLANNQQHDAPPGAH